jgi:phage terminase large subunit-like protein
MPSFHCNHAGCPAVLDAAGYCAAHQSVQVQATARRHAFYDRDQRDPKIKAFRDTQQWRRLSLDVRTDHPTCQRCNASWSTSVHHVKPLNTPDGWEHRLDREGLRALCDSCHELEEREAEAQPEPVKHAGGRLHVVEDETYRFDVEKADKPIRFVEKFARHYEGRFAGQPFLLLPWQRDLVRTLFGWVHRETGLRRFRELYLISAKGAGKTPLLAALALYCLLADGEAAPHVISMASTFEQANLTFSAGKAFINECPALGQHVDVIQYAINTHKHGKWTTISGKPTGRSGPRPSCIVADEVHEWSGPTAQAYELLCANLFKRSQPLLLVATNAGSSRSSYAYTLHERACKVLAGELDDPTLLPVVFEAPDTLPWDSEDAARAANPSIPDIVRWEQLQPAVRKARENEANRAHYQRLYLSRWVQGVNKWLAMSQWDACTGDVDPSALVKVPLFVGLDLSQGDDLCASVFVWTTPERYHVTARFWVPRSTADKYERADGHQYRRWAADGAITLLDETTITPAVQARIAAEIVKAVDGHNVKAVAYDPYRSDAVIAAIEVAHPLKCYKVRQGFTLSSGCTELERRLKSGEIVIAPNPVLRFNAENVEVTTDPRGNIWPVKPGAKGRYAGRRSNKIDGIAALVTAITEAKTQESQPATANWTGTIHVI